MSHLVIFGEIDQELKTKIFNLRKTIKELGYDTGNPYIYTVPHLTLATNANFTGDVTDLKMIIQNMNSDKFHLLITDFIVIDNNVAIKFINTHTSKLAREIAFALRDFSFDPVETYFMKLVRSEVKPEFQEKVKSMLKEIIPDKLEIIKISAAGGDLTEKDIFWSLNLNE